MTTVANVFADAAARLERDLTYARDVQAWADGKIGAFMWSAQQAIAESTMLNKRTAVRSCHSSGKSFTAAIIGSHHIDTHEPKTARLITTAPSQTQVRGVLWNEINSIHEKARDRGTPLLGRVNQTEWRIGSYLAGIGRKPNDYNPEVFAGFHARFPMVILDEADGLPREMWDGVEALMTSKYAKLLSIGNPLDPGSVFAGVDADPEYNVMKIAASDTPGFTGEKVPGFILDQLISKEWVDGRYLIWGPDNPFWYGRVLAEYPPEALATIIHAAYIQACMRPDDLIPAEGFVQLGVDVAGSETGDRTVVRERRGDTALRCWRVRTADDDAVENLVVEKILETGARRVCIDATGFGHFFPGRIRKRVRGVQVVAVNFSAAADLKNEDGSRKFENMRAQLWWETGREKMRTGSVNLSFMDDPDGLTVADLTSARYDPEKLAKGIIKVEDKKDIEKRLGRSPDDGDAFLLAFHEPNNAGGPVRVADTSRYSFPTGIGALVRT